MLCFAKHLAGRGLIETRLDPGFANRLQQSHRLRSGNVGCIFRTVETHAHMALCGQIINFFGLDLRHEPRQGAGVAQISIVQKQPVAARVRVFINRVEPSGVERARAPDDAVDFVALGQQQFRQIRTVLPGDARDQSFFRHNFLAQDSESRSNNASPETPPLQWRMPLACVCVANLPGWRTRAGPTSCHQATKPEAC